MVLAWRWFHLFDVGSAIGISSRVGTRNTPVNLFNQNPFTRVIQPQTVRGCWSRHTFAGFTSGRKVTSVQVCDRKPPASVIIRV